MARLLAAVGATRLMTRIVKIHVGSPAPAHTLFIGMTREPGMRIPKEGYTSMAWLIRRGKGDPIYQFDCKNSMAGRLHRLKHSSLAF